MQLDIQDIQKVIPHRYPFLLIDKIVDLVPGEKCVAIKNVTANEEFFEGHFPGEKVMPGVLMLEAMAQAACVLFYYTNNLHGKDVTYYLGKLEAKYRKKVGPGDQLVLEVTPKKIMARNAICNIVAKVDDEVAVEATIGMGALIE